MDNILPCGGPIDPFSVASSSEGISGSGSRVCVKVKLWQWCEGIPFNSIGDINGISEGKEEKCEAKDAIKAVVLFFVINYMETRNRCKSVP